MSFSEAVATQPDMLRLWVLWLTVAMIAAPLILLVFRPSRRAGLVTLLANVAAALSMQWLYGQVGFVRLLGLAHVVFWVPLLAWLLPKLRAGWPAVPRAALTVFLLTIGVSLVFDVADVIRYIAGDRSSLVP